MGIGFSSYQSVSYYATKGKHIKIPAEITLPYSNTPTSTQELKGLLFWCNTEKEKNDNYFDTSALKNISIAKGSSFYKDVFIVIKKK